MVEYAYFHLRHRIYYFPRGLEEFFPKLLKIHMDGVELKEIHQSDLKPFTELEILSLSGNNLENLEEDLLKFNPKLKAFGAGDNKISYIDPNVFDHLSHLRYLLLDKNVCKLSNADNSRTKVQEIIKVAKKKCSKNVLLDVFKVSMRIELLKNNNLLDSKLQNIQQSHDSMKVLEKRIIGVILFFTILITTLLILHSRKRINLNTTATQPKTDGEEMKNSNPIIQSCTVQSNEGYMETEIDRTYEEEIKISNPIIQSCNGPTVQSNESNEQKEAVYHYIEMSSDGFMKMNPITTHEKTNESNTQPNNGYDMTRNK